VAVAAVAAPFLAASGFDAYKEWSSWSLMSAERKRMRVRKGEFLALSTLGFQVEACEKLLTKSVVMLLAILLRVS
jgi:hypothetical protein